MPIYANLKRSRTSPSRPATSLTSVHTAPHRAAIRRILRSTGAQAKLTLGQPNDKYEQEADRVADQVMAMPDTKLQGQLESEEEEDLVQAKPDITPLVQRQVEPEEEGEQTIQTKSLVQRQAATGEDDITVPPIVQDVMHSPGRPLDPSTRQFMESRFGYDLSRVRIHDDTMAANTARMLASRAFTVGPHIVFGAGQFSPTIQAGRHLIAHELTHVVQQGQSQPTASRTPVKRSASPAADMIQRVVDEEVVAADLERQDRAPKDMDPGQSAEIGREAMRAIGYEELIALALEVGLLQRRNGAALAPPVQRQLVDDSGIIQRQGAAEAVTFGSVFSRWAVAAGVASQVDSPAPGPGDAVALGILAIGLVVAGVTVLMSQHGRGNVADTGILEEAQSLIAAGAAATICAALALLMDAARRAADTDKMKKIKGTQKAKGCRPSRSG